MCDNSSYPTRLLSPSEPANLNAEVDVTLKRADLERIERELIPLLVTIQQLLGKEPTVLTREMRRKK